MKQNKRYIYGLNDQLTFGKHKGHTIRQLLQQQPDYLLWVVEDLKHFAMSDEAWNYAISINAKFSLLQPKPKTTHSANTVESTNADGIEVLNHYPWKDCAAARAKFMAYARQVAEDVVLVVEQRNLSPIQLTLF